MPINNMIKFKSVFLDLQRWCPNHWLNLWLFETGISIWTKRTPHNKICEIKQRCTRRRTMQRHTKTTKSQKKPERKN